jgi:diguanylate cyclase (GGDEF)-like protein
MPLLKVEGGDEVAKLSATFNRMVKTLQQQMVSLSNSEEMQRRYLTLEREEQARLMALLAVMNVGVLFVSRENRILHVNPTFYSIWNISEDVELEGREVSEMPGYISHLLVNDKTVAQHLLELPESTDLYLADNRVVIQTRYVVRDVEAQILGHLWMYEDVTHARRTPEQLLHLAEIDPLTGVYNRHRFAVELEHALLDAKRNGSKVALISFSLEEMDAINEAYGYAGGDKVLTRVADTLGKVLRANEICCRLRGDEFAVLMKNATEHDVQAVIKRVSQALETLDFDANGSNFRVTVNSGYALYPDHGEDQAAMLAHADDVISAAKEAGKE